MAKAHAKLQSTNVDALLKLRDDIGTVLSYKRQELETQLQRLGGGRATDGTRPNDRSLSALR